MHLGKRTRVNLALAVAALVAFCVATFVLDAREWRMPLLVAAALGLAFAYVERDRS